MNSRVTLIAILTAALSVGGLMADQDTSWRHRQASRMHMMDRMSTALNLTDQQKQQAKSIFASEREAARPAREQLREERKAVQSAIRAGKSAEEVQQLANREGAVLGKIAGMRAATFAKFYAVLTPAQQQKLASLHQEWRQRHAAESGSAGPGSINSPESR